MRRLVLVVPLLSVFLLTGTDPLSRARGQSKSPPKPAWEWKAVSFGADEKEATKKLDELAADGWEYVGPLANGLVAFKRANDASQPNPKAEEGRGSLRRAFYRSGNAAQQRNAVIDRILRTQAALADLESRQENPMAAVLSEALDRDEQVRDLRAQIAKAQADLDEFRSRGSDLNRPTPVAARRAIAELEPRLARRVRQIKENLRSAENPEALRGVRRHLLDELAELQEVLDGLNADVEKGKGRKPTDAPASR